MRVMRTGAAAYAGLVVIALSLPRLSAQTPAPSPAQTSPPFLLESLAGADSFERYCAPCHGRDGRGTGPVGSALRTRPTDLTTLARRNGGAFPRERVLGFVMGTGRALAAHGSTEMPVWGPIFRAFESDSRVRERVDNLMTHVEAMQVPSTAPNDEGSRLFRTHCAACHGPSGRGDGPMVGQLRRPPPDLTKFTARNGGVFPRERVYRIVDGRDVASHGDRDMPVWGDAFRASRGGDLEPEQVKARIAAIVRYLEGIQERAAE